MPGESPRLVLVVEDEAPIADLLCLNLEHGGYRTHVARDGAAALDAVRTLHPAMVLLDIGLPGMDGVQVCRALRARGDWTPVVFVTARDDEVDRVVGIELGADDYITKPFSPREVLARVGAVLRRTERTAYGTGQARELRCGQVRCFVDERRVIAGEREVTLTAMELDLLAHLMASPERVYSRAQLLSQVWGYDSYAGERTVDVHIAQLRAKLAPHDIIRTVRGVGYAASAREGP